MSGRLGGWRANATATTFILALLLLTTLPTQPPRSHATSAAQAESIPGEFIVGFKKEFHIPDAGRQLAVSKGGKILKELAHPALNAILVRVPLQRVDTFQRAMKESPLIRYVEPNVIVSATVVPNDPGYGYQWALPKIQAPQAWDISTGSSSVRVGVIDSGIDYSHPDIVPNYESCGYDWVNNDPYPMDDHGHGTHVAGTIAARTSNGIGVAGIAGGWGSTHGVTLIAEKVLNSTGDGSTADLAIGITHAVDACGVSVINMSLGWDGWPDTAVRDALQHASDHGVISVAAAGNNRSDASSFYPCAYGGDHPLSTAELVMCVSATDSSDQYAWFTNHGNPVDISAPGDSIWSTFLGNSYASMSGTSMATSHASAVVALVRSQFPIYTRDRVWNYVVAGAEDHGAAGWDAYFGWGRLNAYLAVSAVMVTVTETLAEISTMLTPGTTTKTATSHTSTSTSTSTIPTVTTVVLVPVTRTSTIQSTQYTTSVRTTTVTSYTSTQSSTSTVVVPTTVTVGPSTMTTTVQTTQVSTSSGTTMVTAFTTTTSYLSTTTSTSISVVYTTVTRAGASVDTTSSLVLLGFLSLLAVIGAQRVTASNSWRIPRLRMGRRCSGS